MEQGTVWGDAVGIRPLRIGDAAALQRMMMDPDVAHLLFEDSAGEPPPVLFQALGILLNRLVGASDFGIVERSGRLVGCVRLWRVSEKNRSAMLTIYIGERSRWGKGYGTDTLRLVLREAFDTLKLHRVELHVFDFNHRAIRCYEKVGFVREGARRQGLLRQGRYHDILIMGILRDEFSARELERQEAAATREE